jgi:hypothetical protein
MSLDRRLHAILARLEKSSGGEAVAALSALERLLPHGASLADVLFVGLHHMRQDIDDPSIVKELRRVSERADSAERQSAQAQKRLDDTEQALDRTLAALAEIRRDLQRR